MLKNKDEIIKYEKEFRAKLTKLETINHAIIPIEYKNVKNVIIKEGYLILEISNLLWQYDVNKLKKCIDDNLVEAVINYYNLSTKYKYTIKIKDLYGKDRDTKIFIIGVIYKQTRIIE